MVSKCCTVVVKEELEKLGIAYASIELGVVEIISYISDEMIKMLAAQLAHYGLEIIDNKEQILVERIKNVITNLIFFTDEAPKITYSNYISECIGLNYTYLSNFFAFHEGTTIRDYIILYKIERVKELILQEEHSLKEISYILNYSSVAHLSGQFKRVTGMCPTEFKENMGNRQNFLEDIG